jgi:glycine/D-amino acid oxidase-like deaminating enzyme
MVMSGKSYDIAIIGGGIVGLAPALALTEQFPRLRLAVVEKEARAANSPIAHGGSEAWRCSRSHVASVHRELESEPRVSPPSAG